MDARGEPKAGVIIDELVMLDECLQRRLNQLSEDRRALTVVLDNSDNAEAQHQHQHQLQLHKTLKTSVNLQLPDPDSVIYVVCATILQLEDEKALTYKRLVGLKHQVVRRIHACMYIQCCLNGLVTQNVYMVFFYR